MKRKYIKTMTALMTTVVLGSSLLTGCSSKKDTPTDAVNQNVTQEPTTEPTQEPVVATQTPTKEPEASEGETPATPEISIETNNFSYEVNDQENEKVPLASLSMDDIIVTVAGNETASQKINDLLQKKKKEFIDLTDGYVSDAKTTYDYLDEDSREYWYGYSIDSHYHVERSDKNCFSVLRSTSYEFGGPHPNNECLVYNFNPENGDQLTLNDIVEDMPAFKEMVNEKILEFSIKIDKEIREEGNYAEDDTILIPGYEENIPNILQDDNWYFSDKGFVIIANEDTISSHAYGSFDIEIPYEELQYVKEQYIQK